MWWHRLGFRAGTERGLAVVTFKSIGDDGLGKPSYGKGPFFRTLRRILHAYGIGFAYFGDVRDLLRARSWPRRLAVLALYSEERLLRLPELYTEPFEALERFILDLSGREVLHGSRTGRLIADKTATNLTLAAADIATPDIVDEPTTAPVFVNANSSTAQPTRIALDSGALSVDDYNTRFIDTRVNWQGCDYYVALRAMAVGRRCVGVVVRAADARGGPAVRAATTPLDPQLLNYLYTRCVLPRRAEIEGVCDDVGSLLGPGFYAHDLLPERGGGPLHVCETGYKLYDTNLTRRLAPVRRRLVFRDHVEPMLTTSSAHALVHELETQDYW